MPEVVNLVCPRRERTKDAGKPAGVSKRGGHGRGRTRASAPERVTVSKVYASRVVAAPKPVECVTLS